MKIATIKMTITSIGEDMKKLESSYITSLENSLIIPENVKHRVTISPSNSTPRYIPKKTENICPYKTCKWTFIAVLFIILPNWWMDKHKVIYPYNETLSSIKRNGALIHATIWMHLENMRCEISQTQRIHAIWSHLYEMFRISKSTETESILKIAKG